MLNQHQPNSEIKPRHATAAVVLLVIAVDILLLLTGFTLHDVITFQMTILFVLVGIAAFQYGQRGKPCRAQAKAFDVERAQWAPAPAKVKNMAKDGVFSWLFGRKKPHKPRRQQVKDQPLQSAKKQQKGDTSMMGTLVADKLHQFLTVNSIGGTVQERRGPFTMTCRVMLSNPMDSKKLLGMSTELGQHMNAPTRIYAGRAGLIAEIELPKGSRITPPAIKLGEYCRGSSIAVGLSNQFGIKSTVLEEHGSFYWIGSPGSGKSQAMMSFLYCVLRSIPSAHFLVCASFAKIQKDWQVFGQARGCLGLVSDCGEMETAIQWSVDQMHAGLHQKLIVVIDDLTALTERIDVQSELDQIALEGRDINCHLMVGTHDAGSKSTAGVKKGRSGMTFKVMYGTGDHQSDARSAGRGAKDIGLTHLSGAPGDAILVERSKTMRLATPWLNSQDALALPQQHGEPPRPWVRTADRSAGRSAVDPHPSAAVPQQNGQIRRDFRRSVGDRECVDVRSAPATSAETHTQTYTADHTADWEVQRMEIIRRLPDAFPIRPARPLQEDEAELVLFLEEEGFSQNELCWSVFTDLSKSVKNAGSKVRRGHIKDALALARGESSPVDDGDEEPAPPSDGPTLSNIDQIDLSTEEGRALFEEMQRSGMRMTIIED